VIPPGPFIQPELIRFDGVLMGYGTYTGITFRSLQHFLDRRQPAVGWILGTTYS